MATKKTYWECSFCKRLYDEEGQAAECERHHAELSGLKVIDCVELADDPKGPFPGKILLKNVQDEGLLAEYTLTRQGAVADFYQAGEQWHHI